MYEQSERNYVLVQVNKPKIYTTEKEFKYNGYIDLVITTKSDLHIHSGLINSDNAGVYRSTYITDGKAIIPGSSMKGCVRNMASIISDSCLHKIPDKTNLKYRYENIKCTTSACCIVCDMFGMMGKKSKISFTDMVSDNAKLKVIPLPKRHSAKNGILSAPYHEGQYINGYKIYNPKEISQGKGVDRTQVINKGATFTGKVYFEKLTIDELRLLCFSLGISGDICPRIGAYKNIGMGIISVVGEMHGVYAKDGRRSSARLIGSKYPGDYGKDFAKSIAAVKEYYGN